MNLFIFSNDAMTYAYCLILLFLLQRTEGGIVSKRQAAKPHKMS